jgi:hypothetical protein
LFCYGSLLVQQEGFGPQSLGEAYRPAGSSQQDNFDFRKQFLEQKNQKNMEDAEDADVNAGIHGSPSKFI